MKDKRQRQTTPWPMDPNLMLMFHHVIAQQAAQSAARTPAWPFTAAAATGAFPAQQGKSDLWTSIFITKLALASGNQLPQNSQMLARLAQGAAPSSPTGTAPNSAFTHYQQLLANPMMAQSMLHQLAARQNQAASLSSPERHQPPRSPSSSTNSVQNNQMVNVDSDEATEE